MAIVAHVPLLVSMANVTTTSPTENAAVKARLNILQTCFPEETPRTLNGHTLLRGTPKRNKSLAQASEGSQEALTMKPPSARNQLRDEGMLLLIRPFQARFETRAAGGVRYRNAFA